MYIDYLEIADYIDKDKEVLIELDPDQSAIWISKDQAIEIINHLQKLVNIWPK